MTKDKWRFYAVLALWIYGLVAYGYLATYMETSGIDARFFRRLGLSGMFLMLLASVVVSGTFYAVLFKIGKLGEKAYGNRDEPPDRSTSDCHRGGRAL